MIKRNSFNELFIEAAIKIKNEGIWTKPRKFKCKEILNEQLILTNPEKCLITIEDRKLNYAYLIIEKFMYLSGFCDPNILIHYNSRMKNWINKETGTFDGAYGPRISKNRQTRYCYEILKKDPDSRQAVITINDYTDRHESLDIPCTMYFQFIIRDKKLYMTANMRSNDLLWGTCLDIPAFCFLGEVMAYWLGVKFERYTHNATSLHYYDNYEKDIMNLATPEKQKHEIINYKSINNKKNPKWDIKFEDMERVLNIFWEEEQNIRLNKKSHITGYNAIDYYLEELKKYNKNKVNKNKS